MEITRLLEQVIMRMPSAKPAETLRMAMLLCHSPCDGAPAERLDDPAALDERIRDLELQLAGHEDQHAAIAQELDSLASTEPCHFSVQHLWTLIRAIKVQSQLLNFYLGPQPAVLETARS